LVGCGCGSLTIVHVSEGLSYVTVVPGLLFPSAALLVDCCTHSSPAFSVFREKELFGSPQTDGVQITPPEIANPLASIFTQPPHGSLSSQNPFPALAEVYAPMLNINPNTVPKIIFLIAVSLFCFEITSYGVGESQAHPNTQDTARIIITNAVTSIRAAVSAKTAA